MPWLMKEVKKEMGYMIESRELLMGKYHDISSFSLHYAVVMKWNVPYN